MCYGAFPYSFPWMGFLLSFCALDVLGRVREGTAAPSFNCHPPLSPPSPSPPPRHGGLWGTVSALFFHPGLRDTKKGGPGGPPKLDPFFCRFWGLPGGPQEGSLSGDSSILTFAAGPQKGSNMGAKMERFGHPNPSYTHFGPPFVRNRCPKSCIEKRLQNLGSKRTTLGGQKSPKTDIWGTLGSVGVQMGARTAKISKIILFLINKRCFA